MNTYTLVGHRLEDRKRRLALLGAVTAVVPVATHIMTSGAAWSAETREWLTAIVTGTAAVVAFGVLIALVRLFDDQAERFETERQGWRADAHTDPLCGIPNRRGAAAELDRMRAAARPGERWNVVALDVDRFKSINDRYGHAVGDRVLVAVAEAIAAGLPEGAALARWGGDEFVVFAAGGAELAEQFRERVASSVDRLTVESRGGAIAVSVSTGTAHDLVEVDFDTVLARADDELMAVKARRNAVDRPLRLPETAEDWARLMIGN